VRLSKLTLVLKRIETIELLLGLRLPVLTTQQTSASFSSLRWAEGTHLGKQL
jgi:hypothetical protein